MPLSAVCTLGIIGGMSYYALSSPIGKFNSWRGPLYGGIMGLLLLNLSGLGSYYFYGPNAFSSLVFSVEPYIGIGLFSAF